LSPGSPALAVAEWLSSLVSLLKIILGFSVVIFVHELGHFVMAKLCGVRVDKFAIGFGKELVGRTFGETRYSFNVLPLGGYVKMLGQEDFTVDKEGEWTVKDDPRAFTNKPVGRRMLIVSAGVIMNLVFAALAFMAVFMLGYETMPPVVGQVVPGSPAQKAGLMPGDRILMVNGTKMDDYPDVKSSIILADADRPITLKVLRPGRTDPFEISLEPEWSEEEKVRQIGIYPSMTLQIGAVDVENDVDEQREDRLHVGDTIVAVNGVRVEDHDKVEQAITEARGEYVQLTVDRPVDPAKMEGPKRRVEKCYHRARMVVMSATDDGTNRHILGLQPRQRLLRVAQGSPADKAGLRAGDIIVRWGDRWNPTDLECNKMLRTKDERGAYVYAGRGIEIVVRRVGMSKEIGVTSDRPTGITLSYGLIEPLLAQRDELTVMARKDLAGARERVLAILGKATTDAVILSEVRSELAKKASAASGLIRWLEDLDCEMFVVQPHVSFWGNDPPHVGVMFGALETDRLIVSRLVDKGLDGRPTPAAALNMPDGSLITQVNGKAVGDWLQLVETFRKHAGQEITLTYTHEGIVGTGKIRIPTSLSDALNLPPTARVVRIAGQEKATFKRDGRSQQVALPAWEAAYEILKAHQGQDVSVVYQYAGKEISTDAQGKPLTFHVTADNYDPWMMRILYTGFLVPFPQKIVLQKRNPIAAMWAGFKKTGYFILQAYRTMEHMVITQKVGVTHISGPVGILRYGQEIAAADNTRLLYFLAFISANLAVINFLPLPIVDGGLFVFLIIEKIRGRPVSIKMQVVTQIIGLVLIITAFIFVTFLDVSKWVTQG